MVPTGSLTQEVTDDPQYRRTAAALIGAGALGVVVTSACYALAGPQAALPGGASSVESARAATIAAAAWMRPAGLVGMPSDVMLAVGGLMLAATMRGPGAALAVAGWLAMAIAGALFIVVDAMVAFVLPPLAALADGAAAYAAQRALFDVLFAIGGWTFGAGLLAAAWPARPEYRRRAVPWLMRAAGVLGVIANTAWFFGLPGVPLIGPAVALGSVALLVLAIVAHGDAHASPGAAARVKAVRSAL